MKYEDLLKYEIAGSWLTRFANIPVINVMVTAYLQRKTERKRSCWLILDADLSDDAPLNLKHHTSTEIRKRFEEFSLVWLNEDELSYAISKALLLQRTHPDKPIPFADIAREVKQDN